ncbi:MAG: NAD(P)-dependent oxidoreductase [Candidatus Giovannonibacteria bacterium]|nr:NAD(P)-dependent oxidoreductase [Candidatus Giovannonibacteria bacterium]
MQKPKILICGGAGYVGGYLTDLLMAKGYNVAVYDNLMYEDRYLKNTNFIYGDIRNKEKLGRIINDFDIVIWLAAIVGDDACALHPLLAKEINLSAVQWLASNYKGKIIYTSTCSVYGQNNNLLDESSEVNTLSHYALTKLKAEKEITKRSKDYLIFRLGTLFGIGDDHARLRFDLAVNLLTQRAASGELLTVFGGEQWRPLLHVRDVADAVLFGIENNISGLFNLSDKNYRVRDIADEIKRVIPHTRVEYDNVTFEDLRNYRVSAAKFMSFGWQPKYNLEYGVREVYRLITDGRIRDPGSPLYSNGQYLKKKVS